MKIQFEINQKTINKCGKIIDIHQISNRDNSRTTIKMTVLCSSFYNYNKLNGNWNNNYEYYNNIKTLSHEFYFLIINNQNINYYTLLKIIQSKCIYKINIF